MKTNPDDARSPSGQVQKQIGTQEQATSSKRVSPADSIKKWLGVIAAVVSAGSAIYGVLEFQAEKTESSRVVEERLTAGRMQQGAKDYPGAWTDLQEAAKVSKDEGLLLSLFGGLSTEKQKVRDAQEDVAMEWLRKAAAPEYSDDFSTTADQVLDFLTSHAASAAGAHKADLLAHVGWAHFGKKVSGVRHQQELNDRNVDDALYYYREAVAADPTNPYANVFWGASLVQGPYGYSDEKVAEATKHFATALSTKREHDTVRKFQMVSLGRYCCAAAKAWWAAVYDMVKAGEPIDAYRERILSDYDRYFAGDLDSTNKADADAAMAQMPPAGHVEMLRVMLKDIKRPSRYFVSAQMALAVNLEASGKPGEAIAVWHDLKASNPSLDRAHSEQVDAAIKRLSAGDSKT
jgi:hypothetical protein